ncbi:MAG: shikimate dehydrogenase, partial [Lachnospiraceae bacterium]|nr:shikimate dehydrogenase [Lachnospiraceae bacterium]
GNPTKHTLSPRLHNTLAEMTGIKMIYAAFPVPQGGVSKAIYGAHSLGISGLNVTAPYKTEVIPYLKAITPTAERLGVVNTLVREEEGFIGHNTDNIGLFRAIKSEGYEIKSSNIIILGAGAAARAAAFLCAEEEAKSIFIINRTKEKALAIASEVNQKMKKECLNGMGINDLTALPNERFIAIQSTSLGMHPNEGQVLIDDNSFYGYIEAGFDMIYNPPETPFMKKISEAGACAVNGLKMLMYQGIAAFELWHQISVSDELIPAVYHKLKENLHEK